MAKINMPEIPEIFKWLAAADARLQSKGGEISALIEQPKTAVEHLAALYPYLVYVVEGRTHCEFSTEAPEDK